MSRILTSALEIGYSVFTYGITTLEEWQSLAECTCLENRRTERFREFESHLFHQTWLVRIMAITADCPSAHGSSILPRVAKSVWPSSVTVAQRSPKPLAGVRLPGRSPSFAAFVYRLGHSPFTRVRWVRFPYAVP